MPQPGHSPPSCPCKARALVSATEQSSAACSLGATFSRNAARSFFIVSRRKRDTAGRALFLGTVLITIDGHRAERVESFPGDTGRVIDPMLIRSCVAARDGRLF